jgi:ribosomal protein S18 acetylase RimI-like enzyme
MSYRFSFLSRGVFPQIYRTFMEAFADYHVDTSFLTEVMLLNRALKNGVDFESSVGAFDGDEMVGVTIVGLDDWKGVSAAYDIGTGIIPTHRGKGLAGRMFEFCVPRLRDRGVKRFVLEVIQENEPAIKAYAAAGFKVTREFDCFQWRRDDSPAQPGRRGPLEIRPVDRDRLTQFEEHLDWPPSWENSFASIRRIPDEVTMYGAFSGDNGCIGLLAYYPLINWITTLVVHRNHRKKGVATALLSHFAELHRDTVPYVKLANVDHSDTATLSLLEKTGFELTVRQFEMELEL